MNRVAVVLALSFALTGCSSFSVSDWIPNMSMGGGSSSGGGYPIQIDSEPPGAEARTSLGPSCRTPCTVAVPARQDFTVSFNLAGYADQTVPVTVQQSGALGSEFSTAVQFVPNPVFAALEPAPPAASKKKGRQKPRGEPKEARPAPTSRSSSPPPASDVPPAQRTIPGAQPTQPPASAWPPPR